MPVKPKVNPQAAKLLYFGIGAERSLKAVAETCCAIGVPVAASTLESWSSKEGWVEQAAEYDAIRAQLTDTNAILIKTAQHAAATELMMSYGTKGLKQLLVDPETGEGLEFVEGKPGDFMKAIDTAVKWQRLIEGMATARIEVINHSLKVIVHDVSPAALRYFDALVTLTEGWPDQWRIPLANKIDEMRMAFAAEVDAIVDTEFAEYGIADAEIVE